MKVVLLNHTPEPQVLAALAARLCYSASDLEALKEKLSESDTDDFINMIMNLGHTSVLEHASFTFGVEGISRVTSHQLVRHRVASFCLTGDTEVVAFRKYTAKARSQKKWTIADLYARQQRGGTLAARNRLIKLRSTNADGVIVPGTIKTILDTGVNDVWELVCKSGRRIRATANHRFLTPTGYVHLNELKVGGRLVANGYPALENEEWLREQYIRSNKTRKEVAVLAGCCESLVNRAFQRFGIVKPHSQYPNRKAGHGVSGMFTPAAKQEISSRMSGEGNHRWKGDDIKPQSGRLRANKMYSPDVCWGCGATKKLERHHLDENPKNNEDTNILFLCAKCHKAFHLGQGVLTVFSDEIVSIRHFGREQTYDIEMENDEHNFVANGLVVHNSQQSQRYVKGPFGVVIPPSVTKNPDALERFQIAVTDIETAYDTLCRMGIPAEDARYLLPNATETKLLVTMNARELLHFFSVRCCERAQWEIREMATRMLGLVRPAAPTIFAKAGPSCLSGPCSEGAKGCGRPREAEHG